VLHLKTYFTVFKPIICIFIFYKHKNISSVHDKSLYCILVVLQFSVAFLMSFILCFDLKYESAVRENSYFQKCCMNPNRRFVSPGESPRCDFAVRDARLDTGRSLFARDRWIKR